MGLFGQDSTLRFPRSLPGRLDSWSVGIVSVELLRGGWDITEVEKGQKEGNKE